MAARHGAWGHRLRRALRGRWIVLPLAAALAYFAWHAMHGQRGLLAWIELTRDVEAARDELAELRREREAVERRVQGLQPDRLDPDLLEEELRNLGSVKEGEVLVLTDRVKRAP
ncbi:MAG TPA: septum formation initiator family protein [Geminicoccaceae bacterium]|nr:septum formation initiator family protein [Geminicoccaceae bacterium]